MLADSSYCATCSDSAEQRCITKWEMNIKVGTYTGWAYIASPRADQRSVQLDYIDYPIIHFFFPFFFLTPPVDAFDVLGKLEPCRTGETAAACAFGAESVAEAIGAAAALDGRRLFIIF